MADWPARPVVKHTDYYIYCLSMLLTLNRASITLALWLITERLVFLPLLRRIYGPSYLLEY